MSALRAIALDTPTFMTQIFRQRHPITASTVQCAAASARRTDFGTSLALWAPELDRSIGLQSGLELNTVLGSATQI